MFPFILTLTSGFVAQLNLTQAQRCFIWYCGRYGVWIDPPGFQIWLHTGVTCQPPRARLCPSVAFVVELGWLQRGGVPQGLPSTAHLGPCDTDVSPRLIGGGGPETPTCGWLSPPAYWALRAELPFCCGPGGVGLGVGVPVSLHPELLCCYILMVIPCRSYFSYKVVSDWRLENVSQYLFIHLIIFAFIYSVTIYLVFILFKALG